MERVDVRGWLRPLVTTLVVLLLVGALAGYAVADLRGAVPGILTTAPAPLPYPGAGSAPGAKAPAPASAPLTPLSDTAPQPNPAVLSTQLAPLLASPALGPDASGTVVDAATGTVLFDGNGGVPHEPASVAKVLTGAAALRVLGADTTLDTTVLASPGSDQVSLVGSGDVLMAADDGNPDKTNGRAGLADLAAQVATALKLDGRTTVRLSLDDSVLGGLGWGEAIGPGWVNADITSGYVAPVTGLAVDAGRIRAENYAPRVGDPGLDGAQQFAAALKQEGVTVSGPVTRSEKPTGATVLGTVSSAPISEIVAYALAASDNNAAESLARLVAGEKGQPVTFAGGGAAVLAEVAALGVSADGCVLSDGSGLSDGSKLTASLLAGTLAAAATDQHPELRALLRALPVAGLTGTLVDRFAGPNGGGVGRVHAKTGSLTRVSSLAGSVTTADGRLVTFAFLADQAPATDAARQALDQLTVAVAGCGCR